MIRSQEIQYCDIGYFFCLIKFKLINEILVRMSSHILNSSHLIQKRTMFHLQKYQEFILVFFNEFQFSLQTEFRFIRRITTTTLHKKPY